VDAVPRTSDGQLLFLMEMISKMKVLSESTAGSRIASVHNGSSLFTGDAGSGESNIRRHIIENDLLEAIIQLPNKGHNLGAGNPPNKGGHKSAYLWEDVFKKESIADIIEHFIRLSGRPKDPLNKRRLFFPRYHQMDVVRKLAGHAAQNGVGHTCLVQHSAGSGKSNSITWAAYRLIETYPAAADIRGVKGVEQPLFDSVIVVTDRRLLDKQLRETIREFSEVKNIIAPAYRSQDLKAALEQGKKIIITTIQKFLFILDGIGDLRQKNFAMVIDEAHSSQSGTAHDNMNRVMGRDDQEDEDSLDAQDKILKAMAERRMRENASYFAFTATPKNTTLEKFGIKQPDSRFVPFHLYSMKQAIEEGFILDVLANYTTYKSYYEIQKSIQDNPLFDSKKAQKKLRAYVERHQQTIAIKADIILGHFIPHVVNQKKLKGKAKAMVVTQNIVKDPKADEIDELLNSVDLSSYGLQRVKLNHRIRLNEEETELDPQNPNPRGAHGGDEDHDPLDDIVRRFNERWFPGWSATPEEQRIKFIHIADSIRAHPDFDQKYKNNQDTHNRVLAFQKIFEDVMLKKRRNEMELYKLLAGDAAFKSAMQHRLRQIVDR
jgi:type I site-specific restriction-modification system R (restriction) subunit